MQISRQALKAYNMRRDVTFNDAYNKAQGWGTKAEHDALHRIGSDLHGLMKSAHKLTPANVTKAGHAYA